MHVTWKKIGTDTVNRLAIGADGTAWALENSNQWLSTWTGAKWEKLDGGEFDPGCLCADGQGYCWVATRNTRKIQGNSGDRTRKPLTMSIDIPPSFGVLKDLAVFQSASQLILYVIDANGTLHSLSPTAEQILASGSFTGTWRTINMPNMQPTFVSVSPWGQLFAGHATSVYKNNLHNELWQIVDAMNEMSDLDIGPDGTQWQAGKISGIYGITRFDWHANQWSTICTLPAGSTPTAPTQLAGDTKGNPWILASDGHVYEGTITEDAVTSVPHHNASSWMGDLYNLLQHKALSQMCLPGTHDSATASVDQNEIAPDAEGSVPGLWKWSTPANIGNARAYIKSMAVAQDRPMAGPTDSQAYSGIRYFDLRVCGVSGEWYTCHSLRGGKISDLVSPFKQFLDSNPSEIVVFKVGVKGDGSNGSANLEGSLAERNLVRALLKSLLGEYYYRPSNHSEVMAVYNYKFGAMLATNCRAIILEDTAYDKNSSIYGIYDSDKTTTSGVVNNLQNKTQSFTVTSGPFLEAQLMLPISIKDYVCGYLETINCGMSDYLDQLNNAGVFTIPGVSGASPMPEMFSYFMGLIYPVATNLHDNAKASRSIMGDYFKWLWEPAQANAPRPNLVICDFFEDTPIVDLAIYLTLGVQYPQLNNITDIPLRVSDGLALVNCLIKDVEAIFKLVSYAVEDAAAYLNKRLLQPAAAAMAAGLHDLDYTVDQVTPYLEKAYNLTDQQVASVLHSAQYTIDEIGDYFTDVEHDASAAVATFLHDAGGTTEEVANYLYENVKELDANALSKALLVAQHAASEVESVVKKLFGWL